METEDEKSTTTTTASTTEPFVRLTDAVAAELDALQNAEDDALQSGEDDAGTGRIIGGPAPDEQYDIWTDIVNNCLY